MGRAVDRPAHADRMPSAPPIPDDDPAVLERQVQQALARRRIDEARALAERLRGKCPERISGWLFGAQAEQMAGDLQRMLDLALEGRARAPLRADMAFVACDALRITGAVAEARRILAETEAGLPEAVAPWALLSAKFAEMGEIVGALRAAQRVEAIPGGRAQGHGLAAGALTALGRMEEAEQRLCTLIQENPGEVDAYYQRAVLRRARHGEPALEQTRRRLAREPDGSPASAPLHYALGKMLEDLGELDAAFDHFDQGARARRARMGYRVEDDEAAIDSIIRSFNDQWLAGVSRMAPEDGPVFVMGLPRTGTTLVERMLSSHSAVASVGEVNDLAYAVMHAAGASASKQELVSRSCDADMKQIRAHYLGATRGYGVEAPLLIDKTPANFLYIGLIAAALPGARIVHLRRNPAASGYAMFKTLFRMGYPFSYDLVETARYIAAHRRLMDHWRTLLPNRIIDVDYEELVGAPEETARNLLDRIGLSWEADVMAFHANPAPTATASAAQVREPVHDRSRDLWRSVRHRLTPLTATLEKLGVTE